MNWGNARLLIMGATLVLIGAVRALGALGHEYAAENCAVAALIADSDGSRPLIPRRSRPAFRFDVGHHSEMKPANR